MMMDNPEKGITCDEIDHSKETSGIGRNVYRNSNIFLSCPPGINMYVAEIHVKYYMVNPGTACLVFDFVEAQCISV
jgi:hypothetical protein